MVLTFWLICGFLGAMIIWNRFKKDFPLTWASGDRPLFLCIALVMGGPCGLLAAIFTSIMIRTRP